MLRPPLLIVALLAALIVLPSFLAPRAAEALNPPAAPEVVGEGAAIIDEEGNLVFGKNPHKRYAMASLTKTMTAVVALERIDLGRRVLVDVAWDEIPDSSIMGLGLMEELTVEDLLYGLMLPSGNDAARAIARAISGDEYRFTKLMNAKARELGMINTQFKNPHGMDEDGHYSSAYDQAILGRYAMQNPTLAKIVATRTATVRGRGIYPLRNVNRVPSNYEWADGVKTGFTDNAWSSVVASANRDGRRVYVAVLRSTSYVADAINLLNYYYDNASAFVALPGPVVDTLPVPGQGG